MRKVLVPFVALVCFAGMTAMPTARAQSPFATPTRTVLPIGPLFDQGNTEWCWAYSAFHALRTYYYDSNSNDPAIVAWKQAIKTLDSPDAFEHYMSSNWWRRRRGDPGDLIDTLQSQKNLPEQAWTNYYPSDHQSVREQRARARGDIFRVPTQYLSTNDMIQKVHSNLLRVIPSMFCNGEHCMMIYGDVSDGSNITTFVIGDSLGGVTRELSYDDFREQFDQLVTLP